VWARGVRLAALLLGIVLLGAAPARADETLRLFAAGSLARAMTALLAESGVSAEQIAAPVFGPSGSGADRQPFTGVYGCSSGSYSPRSRGMIRSTGPGRPERRCVNARRV